MELKGSYALIYTHNSPANQKIFPVEDMNHAIFLAEAISRSDNLNKDVSYNNFDLCEYDRRTGEVGESWEHPSYDEFVDYWASLDKKELFSIPDMTSEEKRQKIHDLCQSIPYHSITKCACPFQDDTDSWCHKYTIPDIPDDELDYILKKMEEVVHNA